MPRDYVPKSDGETLLRHQVARIKARVKKLEKEGKEYPNPIVSIAYQQAVDIANRHKDRKEKIQTMLNLAGELSFQLDGEYVEYNVANLRKLANLILVKLSEIK